MSLFDVILIVIMAGFIFYGLFFGLIHTLGGLIGVLAGTIVAGWLFNPIGEAVAPIFWGNVALSKVIVFVVLFLLVNRLAGFVFYLIDRVFQFLKIIPFLKSFNAILGAILGFIEGAFLLGGILYIAARYPVFDWFNEMMVGSEVARYLVIVFKLISPLLPEAVRQLQSLI